MRYGDHEVPMRHRTLAFLKVLTRLDYRPRLDLHQHAVNRVACIRLMVSSQRASTLGQPASKRICALAPLAFLKVPTR
jgi:hypothetical protein